MNKKVLSTMLVATVVAFVGFNINVVNSNDKLLSNLLLDNVEALANGEWGTGFNCAWDWNWTVCDGNGNNSGCPCGSHEW